MGVEIKIWGSCVSREIFNYCDSFEVNCYYYQNSPLCIKAMPFQINEENVCGTSAFARRMVKHELEKCAMDVWGNVKSDFVMVDVADFRQPLLCLKENPKCILSGAGNVRNSIIKQLGGENKFKELFDEYRTSEISLEKMRCDMEYFCNLLKENVDESKIIINETGFCSRYFKDKEIRFLNHYEDTIENREVVRNVENMLRILLPDAIYLMMPPNYIGNYDHHLGFNTLHYVDEVYLFKAHMLEYLIWGRRTEADILDEYIEAMKQYNNSASYGG